MGLLDITYSDINGKKPRNAGLIYESSPVNMSGLLDAATMIPVVGDVLSGGMAVYDAAKGNYGSAAMNALGVLPFVSGTMISKGAKVADAVGDGKKLTKYEQAHLTAQKNAALPVEQGGLGLPVDNTAMDRARAMGYTTPAYHYTPYDFNEFKPHHYRGASFFADTPEGAAKGASAGNGDMQFTKINPEHGGQTMPVLIGGKIYGESNYPDWFIPEIKKYGDYRALLDGEKSFGDIPIQGISENQQKYINGMRREALMRPNSIVEGIPESEWSKYPVVTNKNGELDTHPDFPVANGIASSKSPNGFAPVDYKGFEGFGYDPWAHQPILKREEYRDTLQKLGFDSARVADESGHAIAVMNPAMIRSRFAAFDPMRRHESDILGYADPYLLGGIAGGGLLGLGGYKAYSNE